MALEKARIIVQSDWQQTLRETDATAWVTYSKHGQSSVYGELKSHGVSSDGNPYVSASEGFAIDGVTRRTLTVSYQDATQDPCQAKFVAPSVEFSTVHALKHKVESLDVTEGGLAVSADSAGKLKVWNTANGEIRRELEGHYGDVYSCRFFPSGVVVLTGGADAQIKIWSAETGECAATMTGHKGGVTDFTIVDRGRNIVSVSRDGTAKLWDCGKQACLTTFEELGGVINSCSQCASGQEVDLGSPEQPSSDREVATEGKLLLVACENGTLQGHGLHSKQKIFDMRCSGPVNCCAGLSPTLAACGTQDGQIYVVDLRNTSGPLLHFKEKRSAILSLLPYQQGFFASTGDGSCFLVDQERQVPIELTGPDCDPVYKVVSDGTYLYTCCRDGLIRKYRIS